MTPLALETRIRETAKQRFNAADVSLVRYRERESAFITACEWFGVSIRQRPQGPWVMLGRRQTKTDLLLLVEKLDPAHIGGMTFH